MGGLPAERSEKSFKPYSKGASDQTGCQSKDSISLSS